MKSIKPEEFFKLIALEAGVTDLRVVRDIYYSMIKVISRELKSFQNIKLPDWGNFYLRVQKSRKNYAVCGEGERVLTILPPKTMVKFSPDYKVKKYFYKFGEDGTMLK